MEAAPVTTLKCASENTGEVQQGDNQKIAKSRTWIVLRHGEQRECMEMIEDRKVHGAVTGDRSQNTTTTSSLGEVFTKRSHGIWWGGSKHSVFVVLEKDGRIRREWGSR